MAGIVGVRGGDGEGKIVLKFEVWLPISRSKDPKILGNLYV
jgi:hypothetical protein